MNNFFFSRYVLKTQGIVIFQTSSELSFFIVIEQDKTLDEHKNQALKWANWPYT